MPAVWASLLVLGAAVAELPALERQAEAIDRVAARLVEELPLASASIAILHGGEVAFARAYGQADIENDAKATVKSRYYIGSITKELIAAAVEQMIEAGRLSRETPAWKVLPDLRGPARGVTIAQLLSHTSGLADYWSFGDRSRRTLVSADKRKEIGELFVDRPLLFPPGSRMSYSNSNYYVLYDVVEKLAGRPFEAHIHESALIRARVPEMTVCDARMVEHRAFGYVRAQDHFEHAPRWGKAEDGMLFCATALELATWQSALAQGRVVSLETYRKMVAPVVTRDHKENAYGEGLMLGKLGDHAFVGHGGNGLGFSAMVERFDTDDLTLAVLVSGGSSALLVDSIARLALGLPIPEIKNLPLAGQERAPYLGRYQLPRGRLLIVDRPGGIAMHAEGVAPELAIPLLYQGDHEFVAKGSTVRLRFDVAGGQATRLHLGEAPASGEDGPRVP